MNLSLSIYISAGHQTCYNAGHAAPLQGSLGLYEEDVATLMEWGVDAVKFDWCFAYRQEAGVDTPLQPGEFHYKHAADAEAPPHDARKRRAEPATFGSVVGGADDAEDEEDRSAPLSASSSAARAPSKFVELDQPTLSLNFSRVVKKVAYEQHTHPLHITLHCYHNKYDFNYLKKKHNFLILHFSDCID